MISIEKYKKILRKKRPELTEEEVEKILDFILIVAQQTVSNYKKSMELSKKDEVK
jgi:hypothetical protein